MSKFIVYILRCADESFYVGHTCDIRRRLSEHSNGTFSCYTKSRRPIELVFTQEYETKDEAFWAERKIKGWSRRKKVALIRRDWDGLRKLSSRAKKN